MKVSVQGIDTESDYPYTAAEGTCNAGKMGRHVVTIDGFEDVPPNDEVCAFGELV